MIAKTYAILTISSKPTHPAAKASALAAGWVGRKLLVLRRMVHSQIGLGFFAQNDTAAQAMLATNDRIPLRFSYRPPLIGHYSGLRVF